MKVNVEGGYRYLDSNFDNNLDTALLFTTDIYGGDVSWPGSAWLRGDDDGRLSFAVKNQKYQTGSQPDLYLVVEDTDFSFDEWHTISISFGSQGLALSLNGEVIATNNNTQILYGGGTHSESLGQPTVGESVPSFWNENQYEGGFNGTVESLRFSDQQRDWQLANLTPEQTVDLENSTFYRNIGDAEDNVINAGDGDDTINAGDGDDIVSTGKGADTITLGQGNDKVSEEIENFFGDTYTDFSQNDQFIFMDSEIGRDQIKVTSGSALIDIDTNNDGVFDGRITLEGDYTTGDFMAIADGGNTVVTFETFLPTLQEGQVLDPNLVNGIINQNFLKGDGSSDFQVTLRDMGFAGYDNTIGVYEIDTSGLPPFKIPDLI